MIEEQDSGESRGEDLAEEDRGDNEEFGVETREIIEQEERPEEEGQASEAAAQKTPWRVRAENEQAQETNSAVGEEELDDEELENEEEREGQLKQEETEESDDPLGEAYDLERGEILKPTEVEHRHLPWKSKVSSPKEFFATEILYRHDILEDAERGILRGKYRIELKGFQGGIWTISLGDELEVVNRSEEADVVFTMQQRDFLDLVNGALNPQLAILSRKIKVSGDVKRAVHFQSMLAPNFD